MTVFKIPGFHNHSRVAKRRMLAIDQCQEEKKRKAAYADLIKTTGQGRRLRQKGCWCHQRHARG
jgi:hypothetical protein